jgi:hypothetical protein
LGIQGFREKKISDKKNYLKNKLKKVGMSFMHLKMVNSASKCLKITLEVIKFSKSEKNTPKQLKLFGGISPPPHVKFMPG